MPANSKKSNTKNPTTETEKPQNGKIPSASEEQASSSQCPPSSNNQGPTKSSLIPLAGASDSSTIVFEQSEYKITVQKFSLPNNPFGDAQRSLEDKIIKSLEIHQNAINRIKTLTNSKRFKDSSTLSDVKQTNEIILQHTALAIEQLGSLHENISKDFGSISTQVMQELEDDGDVEFIEPGEENPIELSSDEDEDQFKNIRVQFPKLKLLNVRVKVESLEKSTNPVVVAFVKSTGLQGQHKKIKLNK